MSRRRWLSCYGINGRFWGGHKWPVLSGHRGFLYFDEFYQMEGQVNFETLKKRLSDKQLLDSDRPMLGLIELARINLDQLVVAQNTLELVSRIEGAGNYLSRRNLD